MPQDPGRSPDQATAPRRDRVRAACGEPHHSEGGERQRVGECDNIAYPAVERASRLQRGTAEPGTVHGDHPCAVRGHDVVVDRNVDATGRSAVNVHHDRSVGIAVLGNCKFSAITQDHDRSPRAATVSAT